MNCKRCENEILDKKRRNYCSDDCSKEARKEYVRSRKFNYDLVKKWRILIKQKAIDYKGGCCQVCGYKKCNRSLDFHHMDPSKKDFTISKYKNKKIENLKSELDKCILVCSNCHGEIHDNILDVSNIKINLGIELDIQEKKGGNRCSLCNEICQGEKCKKCYTPKQKYERPSLDILLNDIDILGYRGTGRKYGVSDSAIRKWIKKYKEN